MKWGILFPICFTGFMYFLHEVHFKGGVCDTTKRIDGKTVIITGANTGIGLETAVYLASRGGRVIMACRSLERGAEALAKVKSRAKTNNVELMQLDLASLDSVENFAEEFRQKESRLDILINNAGIMAVPKTQTKDGFESQFGVNHLGHFLLTNLLLDMLESSGPGSRIVTVSSLAHRRGFNFNISDLMMDERPYDKWEQYGNSKLANILFTKELSNQLKGSGVTTYSLHPGVIATELGRSLNSPIEMLFGLIQYTPLRFIMKTIPEGAQTTICCAVSDAVADESGEYYADCARSPLLIPQANDAQLAKELWDVSMVLTGLKQSDDATVDQAVVN